MAPTMNMDFALKQILTIIVRQIAGVKAIIKANITNGIKQSRNREIQQLIPLIIDQANNWSIK